MCGEESTGNGLSWLTHRHGLTNMHTHAQTHRRTQNHAKSQTINYKDAQEHKHMHMNTSAVYSLTKKLT